MRLLSVDGAAIVLGVGAETIHSLVARDQLAVIEIGDHSLIEVESLSCRRRHGLPRGRSSHIPPLDIVAV